MKNKNELFVALLLVMILLFNFFVVLAPADESTDINPNDFELKNYGEKGYIGKDHYLEIEYNGLSIFTEKDVSYKIIGEKDDIETFNRCVDVYQLVSKDMKAIGYAGHVKEWGEYSVDIIPIVKNVEISKYAYWNSSYYYHSGSCIINPYENTSVRINVTNSSTGGNINLNGKLGTSNFSDVRFVDSNTTERYHWIEYVKKDEYAWFWININDSTYLDCYYGLDNAVNSTYNNPYKTFVFFDPFNDLGNWSNTGSSPSMTINNGWLRISSDGSSDCIYYDLNADTFEYFFGTRTNIVDYTSNNAYHIFGLYPILDLVYDPWQQNMYCFEYYDNTQDCQLRYHRYDGHNGQSLYSYSLYLKTGYNIRGLVGYQNLMEMRKDNMELLASEYTDFYMDDYPDIFFVMTRNYGSTYISEWDYVYVGKYDSNNITSFCNWIDFTSQCEYKNFITNNSIVEGQTITSLNISYFTFECYFNDTQADYLNVSLKADNGLFFINNSNQNNDTINLNLGNANFTYGNEYIIYVNISNNPCYVSYDISFNTGQYNLYEYIQVLDYKITQINNEMLKESDELNIDLNFATELVIFLIAGILLILGVVKKDEIIASLLLFASGFICLYAVFTTTLFSDLNLFFMLLCIVSVGIAMYKAYLGYSDRLQKG